MKIREYKPEDYDKVKDLAEKHNLNLPSEGKIILAEDDEGRIVSFINFRMVLFIEPFVSENPLAGKKLFDEAEKRIKEGNLRIVRCFTDVNNKELLEKLGFYEINELLVPFEKNYYSSEVKK